MKFNIQFTVGDDVPSVTAREAALEQNRASTMRSIHGIIEAAHAMWLQWRRETVTPSASASPDADA
jgi:hypothetical protein